MPTGETLKNVIEALGRYDIDAVMEYWADGQCWYDNPMVGPKVIGRDNVRKTIQLLADGLQSEVEKTVVDRTTSGPRHALAEWHIEPGDGSRKGIHVAEFDDAGKVRGVTVYPRA